MTKTQIQSACDRCSKYKECELLKLSTFLREMLCPGIKALIEVERIQESLKNKIKGKCQVEPDLLCKAPQSHLN